MRRTTQLLIAIALAASAAGCDRTTQPLPPDGPTAQEVTALRDELLQIGRDDQMERTGYPSLPPGTKLPPAQDYVRAVRLNSIIDEHGWPTYELVGEQAASAAWLVAQHADFDVALQRRALDLISAAAADGQADRTEAAYLADRVAVNTKQPQTYGSQVRCTAGALAPATPLVDAPRVDELRGQVGMEPLADYYKTLSLMCADEAAEGVTTGG